MTWPEIVADRDAPAPGISENTLGNIENTTAQPGGASLED
jgi:hypothetical protein